MSGPSPRPDRDPDDPGRTGDPGRTEEVATREVATQEVATQEVVTQEVATQEVGTREIAAGETAGGPADGTVLDGRYELRGLLGAGGMSRVYLALDRELDRTVAVKLLPEQGGGGTADDLARLRDEARAAAAVDHPDVVTVHDVGATAGGTYVVMSYVEGETLADRVGRTGPLPVADVVALGRTVCDALGAAHRAGVVHRDVTPGNIILRPDGGLTVTDFGIARIGDGAGRTRTGYILGTPAYLAPEQCDGTGHLDGRADLYALACCLFTALTGRPPFPGDDSFAVVLAHLRTTPPRPSSLRADVPPALEDLLLRTLSKNPDRRPADAGAFAKELAGAVPAGSLPATTPGAGPARTRELPADAVPEQRGRPGASRNGGTGSHRALDDTLADVESDDGRSADRRRGAGLVLLGLAVVLVLGILIAVVVFG